MPIYTYEDTNTGEQFDILMKLSEKEGYEKDNPHLIVKITGAPGIVGGTGDRTRPSNGFQEVLSKISESNPYSALAQDYGKKDHLSVKKREVVSKFQQTKGD